MGKIFLFILASIFLLGCHLNDTRYTSYTATDADINWIKTNFVKTIKNVEKKQLDDSYSLNQNYIICSYAEKKLNNFDIFSDEKYQKRGNLYFQQGQYSFAIQDFTEAIRLGVQDIEIYKLRMESYYKLQMYDKMLKDFINILYLNEKEIEKISNEIKIKIAETSSTPKEVLKKLEKDNNPMVCFLAQRHL